MMKSSSKKPIKWINYGIANSYNNRIELSKDLKGKKYKKLRDYIIKHEKGHKDNFDLKHEFDLSPMLVPLIWFIVTHPKTWKDTLPIQLTKKEIVIDYNLIILYSICLILIGIIIYI